MEKPTVGEFLATLRKEGGYTQQDVADKLNISDRTLSSWETGRTEPDLSSLAALADFYGLTVDEILRGERNADRHLETAIAQPKESDDPIEKFSYKRNTCVAVGVISALVFIVGSLTLLLTDAPLWLDLLFIFSGAVGNIASLILLFRFESKTLCDDADNEAKLALTHSSSFALIFNSLAYICGAIVLFICFYTTDHYYFTDEITDIFVWLSESNSYDYTYTAFSLICIFGGLILLTAGVLRINISARYLGNARQKAAAKYNVKLFKRLCLFGAIPVALSFILLIIFSFVKFSEVDEVYFTANGVDELRKTYQTITYDYDKTIEKDNGTATIPAGEYYLNFETENFVECKAGDEDFTFTALLYDLGNGFYGDFYISDVNYFHLKDGVSADDITCENYFDEYFIYIGHGTKVDFTSPDGEQLTTYAIAHSYPNGTYREWSQGYGDLYYSTAEKVLTRSGSVYTYQRISYYDYSPLLWLIFSVVSAATVLTCTAVHLVKRKKIK